MYDLILFGATGFTGGLTAEYLARHAPDSLRWALAGRSVRKLADVKRRLAKLSPACESLGLVQADVNNPESLAAMAASTRAVVTTVGPYIHYGEPLVKACAEAGTHYLDLTGEPEFVELCLQRYDAVARDTGAKIINCCGFDSIPHDLGVLYTVMQCPADVPLRIRGYVSLSMDVSGGTWQSAIHAFSRARHYLQLRRQRGRSPAPSGRQVRALPPGLRREPQIGGWAVPFPTIDPQVIRRSARALDRYGPDFRYAHYLQLKHWPLVLAGAAGATTLFALAQIPPTRRWLLSRRTAGQGPSPERRARSWFEVRFLADAGGQALRTQVSGGDPGYDETAKMLGEAALCLLLDKTPDRAGVITPAMAFGEPLIHRLQQAGMRFDSQWTPRPGRAV